MSGAVSTRRGRQSIKNLAHEPPEVYRHRVELIHQIDQYDEVPGLMAQPPSEPTEDDLREIERESVSETMLRIYQRGVGQ